MWLFTKYGFFSAVCARQGDGEQCQPIEPNVIMVRGRMLSHMSALKERFPDLLADCEIQEIAGADYAYRLFLQQAIWVEVATKLAEELEYGSFTSEVARHQGKSGTGYQNALRGVWSVMQKLQETEGMPRVSAKQIDALLPYLDRFEAVGFTAGKCMTPAGQFPWFDYTPEVNKFHKVLYDNGWVEPGFPWMMWCRSAEKYVNSPEMVKKANAITILKLMTTHCRSEHFCNGHLASMFENGHMVALLRRLKKIREKMKDNFYAPN